MNFWDWVWSGTGLECNNNLIGLDNPSCPGRVNTSPKETNIIDSTSRMHAHRMADSLRHTKLLYSYLTKGMASAARPCQREAAEGRQSHAAVSWRGADATSMTPPYVLWTRAACSRGWSGCCFALLPTREVSEKSDRALGSWACDRATYIPHSTPHAHSVDW